MKKIYTLIVALFISSSIFATVHTVSVSNFQFSPNNLTIDLGDTIMWMWVGGSHTTTSTTIPSGADIWDEPMNSANQMFEYIPTVEGTYNYRCTPHAGSMFAQFTVVNTSSIKSVSIAEGFMVNPVNNGTGINIGFTVNRTSPVKISLIDLTGKVAKVLLNNMQPAGRYSETFTTDELQKGIYIAEMISGSERYTHRIIIQ